MADADTSEVTIASMTSDGMMAAIDALGFGVALLDGNLSFIDVTERFSELMGRSKQELLAVADPAEVVVAESRHAVAERRATLAAGSASAELHEVELATGSGQRVPIHVASASIVLPSGLASPGLLVVCRDRRPDLALDDSLARLTTLAEVMPVGLIVWDGGDVTDPAEMRLVGANAAAERMTAVELRERLGDTLATIFPDADPVDSARLLALTGTDRMEDLGDAQYATGLVRWQAVGLPGEAVGVLFEDVTRERQVVRERRSLLERLVHTSDDERRRLAMAMHDDPVQKIAAATLLVEAMRRHSDVAPPEDRLEGIETTLRSAMRSLRQLTFELSPPELAESGLEAAVAAAGQHLFEGTDVELTVRSSLTREPPTTVQTAAFRIAAEALTNARKHADASSVEVLIREHAQTLALRVLDDGRGLEAATSDRPGHLGFRAMRERAAALGGTVSVRSRLGGGAVVAVQIPLDGRELVQPTTDLGWGSPDSDLARLRAERDSLRLSVAAALERADLAEGRLRHAFGVTKAMLQPGLSADQICEIAVEHLARALHDCCTLQLLDESGTLRTRASSRASSDGPQFDVAVLGTGPGDGHLGTALRSRQPVPVDRAAIEAGARDLGLSNAAMAHSAIVVPLMLDGEVQGLVTVARDVTETPYDVDDLDYLACLVDRVAIVLAFA